MRMKLVSLLRLSLGLFVSLNMLAVALPVAAQDRLSIKTPFAFKQEKRESAPVAKATQVQSKKTSPAIKVQEGIKLPPKVKQNPPKGNKPATAYGIRPPTNPEPPEDKKPSAKMGIRPPSNQNSNQASNQTDEDFPKQPGKPKKPSNNETASKKPKPEKLESNSKKPKADAANEQAPPAEPQVNEPAPFVAPKQNATVSPATGDYGDPKFGAWHGETKSFSGVETGFLNRAVTVGGVTYRYQVFVPPTWNRRQAWPVVLFLHGAGERGDDGVLQTEVGIGTAIRRDVTRFPAIVVFPQCRKNSYWTENAMQSQALAALEQSVREFNGDRARLYLTGISMGGFGTWGLAASHAGMFAAYAPVCGAIRGRDPRMSVNVKSDDPYSIVARLVGQTPTWIFHGGEDKIVLTEESRKMHEAVKAAGGNVQYTEYPGVGHNSWDKAYAEPKLMEWLLSQRIRK